LLLDLVLRFDLVAGRLLVLNLIDCVAHSASVYSRPPNTVLRADAQRTRRFP
jgi:hypothetical protein